MLLNNPLTSKFILYKLAFIPLIFSFISTHNTPSEDVYVIDDFSTYEDGQFPSSWEGRKKKAEEEYRVRLENDNAILRAHSENSDMFIIKECNVDVTDFKYLNWRWKVEELPENGNESVKKSCDAPAAIAVVFRLSKWRPKSLKYTFSSTLPRFKMTQSPFCKWPARSDIIVLRNETDGLDEWFHEKRNILEDYKMIFPNKKIDELKIEGIMIMTDSDNTKSSATAYYDDIFFSRE